MWICFSCTWYSNPVLGILTHMHYLLVTDVWGQTAKIAPAVAISSLIYPYIPGLSPGTKPHLNQPKPAWSMQVVFYLIAF